MTTIINYYTYCRVNPYKPGVKFVTVEGFETAVGDLMYNQFGERILQIEYRNGELLFCIDLNDAHQASKKGIKEVDDKILSLLNEYYKDYGLKKSLHLMESFVSVSKGEIPDGIKIETKAITLHYSIVPDESISLHDIHKKIDCEHLQINGTSKIKDSVLGLLKIKKLKTLRVIGLNKAEWFDIVLKHFQTDKNILDCQEELMDNGLKRYAKL